MRDECWVLYLFAKAWRPAEENVEAFYDILDHHKDAIKDYPLIKEIVKEVTAAVRGGVDLNKNSKIKNLYGIVKASAEYFLRRNFHSSFIIIRSS